MLSEVHIYYSWASYDQKKCVCLHQYSGMTNLQFLEIASNCWYGKSFCLSSICKYKSVCKVEESQKKIRGKFSLAIQSVRGKIKELQYIGNNAESTVREHLKQKTFQRGSFAVSLVLHPIPIVAIQAGNIGTLTVPTTEVSFSLWWSTVYVEWQ